MAGFTSGGVPIRIDQQEPTTGRHPAVLLLHGSGGNVNFWFDRIAPQLSKLNLGLYAARYFDRTATIRATTETILDGYHFPTWLAVISDAIAYLRTRPTVDPERIALLGISLGAFLAVGTAANASLGIRALIEVSGGIPELAVPQMSSSFPSTLIVHGDADTVVPVSMAHDFERHLREHKVPYQTLILPGQGHWFDGRAQLNILMTSARFLATHL